MIIRAYSKRKKMVKGVKCVESVVRNEKGHNFFSSSATTRRDPFYLPKTLFGNGGFESGDDEGANQPVCLKGVGRPFVIGMCIEWEQHK